MNHFINRPVLALMLIMLPSIACGGPLPGEDMFKALGCRGCHRVGGSGGSLGPALDGLDKRLSPEKLRRILTVRREGSAMPSYAHLTEPELAALLNYLKTL